MRRAFVVVIDACGAGELPDAAEYGDAGSNTLVHLAQAVGGLHLPTFQRLGLGSIIGIEGVAPAADPAIFGRVGAQGPGKESTTGHWELMGAIPQVRLPTYPRGFPPEVVAALERTTGHTFLCNTPYNGIGVIEDFGEEHLRSGSLILYTSQDSVLQLACHTSVLSEPELVEVCRTAREVMRGEHSVGRVIARPFEGERGSWRRTEGRKDLALEPPARSYLDVLTDGGVPVHAVGKIRDLFAGVGITKGHPGTTNAIALASTARLIDELDHGLAFTNLVETDQVYGHRKDVEGFHRALQHIDATVGEWLERLGPDDLLVLTADHGCDPAAPHTDHTREYAPLLAVAPGVDGHRHDGALADVGASVHRWLTGSDEPGMPGRPFL
ncbi:MAG: phosphopentomutase [Solirubrobacteraceae bacterium]|nr:phosphopentomutase [Solirubrobacteraceae bacterium]